MFGVAADLDRPVLFGKRPRTSARLTAAGRSAFQRHVAALQEIVARGGASLLPPPT
jgi:hypothetical protein